MDSSSHLTAYGVDSWLDATLNSLAVKFLPIQRPDFASKLNAMVGAAARLRPMGLRFGAAQIARRWLSQSASSTPDFNTDVNVHEHSISLKVQRRTRAENLEQIKARTGGSLIPESIKHVEEDEEHAITAENLRKLGQVDSDSVATSQGIL